MHKLISKTLWNMLLALPLVATCFGQVQKERVMGRVIKVSPVIKNWVKETPVIEEKCIQKKVPVYGERTDSFLPVLFGSLFGAAVGKNVSDSDSGSTVGAVVGASLAKSAVDDENANREITGYETKNICEKVKVVYKEDIEKVVGYRLKVRHAGSTITLNSKVKYDVGDQIPLLRTTRTSTAVDEN